MTANAFDFTPGNPVRERAAHAKYKDSEPSGDPGAERSWSDEKCSNEQFLARLSVQLYIVDLSAVLANNRTADKSANIAKNSNGSLHMFWKLTWKPIAVGDTDNII